MKTTKLYFKWMVIGLFIGNLFYFAQIYGTNYEIFKSTLNWTERACLDSSILKLDGIHITNKIEPKICSTITYPSLVQLIRNTIVIYIQKTAFVPLLIIFIFFQVLIQNDIKITLKNNTIGNFEKIALFCLVVFTSILLTGISFALIKMIYLLFYLSLSIVIVYQIPRLKSYFNILKNLLAKIFKYLYQLFSGQKIEKNEEKTNTIDSNLNFLLSYDIPLEKLEQLRAIQKKVGIDKPDENSVFENFISQIQETSALLKNLSSDFKNHLGNFIFCLDGPWGSGKTSFVNILKNNTNESIKWIDFNPWNYSNQTELITDFFNTLEIEFKRNNESIKTDNDFIKYIKLITPVIEGFCNPFLPLF